MRGRLVPFRRGFTSAVSGLCPAESVGCRAGEGRASSCPVSPVGQPLKAAFIPPCPVLCGLLGRRWRQVLAGSQHGGFSQAGWRQLPPRTEGSASGAGAPAWPRLFCLASPSCSGHHRATSSRSPRRFGGRNGGGLTPISSLKQLPVAGTVCAKEELPAT